MIMTKSRPPSPPFVELSFYAHDRPERELLGNVASHLAARGATSTGRALVHSGVGREEPFGGPTDSVARAVAVPELSADALDAVEGRLVEIEVAGAFRYDRQRHARVTFQRVDKDHVGQDRHPVTVWASGDGFSGPPTATTRRAGKEVREVFDDLVEAVRPSYAAITVAFPLLSPKGMAADLRTAAYYGDFFLSGGYVGEEALAEVQRAAVAAGCSVAPLADGVVVMSYAPFGGSGVRDYDLGAVFGRAVARQARRSA